MGLPEDATHFTAGKPVDHKETDCSKKDQNETESGSLVHRTPDIEVKDPHGHHLMAWNHKEECC